MYSCILQVQFFTSQFIMTKNKNTESMLIHILTLFPIQILTYLEGVGEKDFMIYEKAKVSPKTHDDTCCVCVGFKGHPSGGDS